MNRLTKQEANVLSHTLIAPKLERVKKLEKIFQIHVMGLYKLQIPEEVKQTFEKYPEYFTVDDHIRLDSHGFSSEWVDLPNENDRVLERDGSTELKLTRELAKELYATKMAWVKENDKVEKLRKEIEQALVNLGTYNRIVEQFPEAAPLLPKKYSPPAVNYNRLKPVVKELATSILQ